MEAPNITPHGSLLGRKKFSVKVDVCMGIGAEE
jgi:hypothetical protein